jgi:GT2 family glycosyltransferase
VEPIFKVICATRVRHDQFATGTALGRSLALFRNPSIEVELYAENRTGLAQRYNAAIDRCRERPAYLVFAHDDIHLVDLFWPHHVMQGLKRFDVIGAVGNRRRLPGQPAWRFKDAAFTQDESENLSGWVMHGRGWPAESVDFYGLPGHEVKLLDGLLLAARSDTLLGRGVRFDEQFEFHFYDMDFCRTAEREGLRLGTWSIPLIHESDGNFDSPAWRDACRRYLKKWGS